MKLKDILILCTGTVSLLLYGCESSPIDGEQYFKQVYLVGASDVADGPYKQEVHYSDEEQETFFSIATGGSQLTDVDIHVNFDYHPSTIEWYNFQYLFGTDVIYYQQLPESNFRIQEKSAVIHAGEVYSKVPVYIKTQGLHCDSLYAISVKITDATLPWNQQDSALLLAITLVNDYSGIYQMSGTKMVTSSGMQTALSVTRSLIAIDENSVRYYHESTEEKKKQAAEKGIVFTVDPEDNTVSVRGYENFGVKDGGGTWDPATKTLKVWYTYNEGNTEYRDDLVFVQ